MIKKIIQEKELIKSGKKGPDNKAKGIKQIKVKRKFSSVKFVLIYEAYIIDLNIFKS